MSNGWVTGLGMGMRYGQLNKFYNFGLIFTFKIEEKKEGGGRGQMVGLQD